MSDSFAEAISGAAGGAFSSFMVYPLERIKTNLQVVQEDGNGRVVKTTSLCGPRDLEVAEVVLEEHREVVAAAQTFGPQELGQPVGARIELRVAEHLAGARRDGGGLVRAGLGVVSRVHARPPHGGSIAER